MALLLNHQEEEEEEAVTMKVPKKVALLILNPYEGEECQPITVEREELMVVRLSAADEGMPTVRQAHFLKPLVGPTGDPPPLPRAQLFLSSNPKSINKLGTRIYYKGRKRPHKTWKGWVEKAQKTHEGIWKEVGILDAIMGSTYNVKRDNELIMNLAQKWCPETNTFVFPWGECTVTLEDVMVLGGFSVLGGCVLSPFRRRKVEEVYMMEKMLGLCDEIKQKCYSRLPFTEWMKFFEGKGDEVEHVALLAQWLSRFVFSTDSYYIDLNFLPLAISLAMGTKVALAPAVLASLYRDLTLLKEEIVAFNNQHGNSISDLHLWSPMQLVQVWAWERFTAFCPEPVSLVLGEARLARWHDVKKIRSEDLMLEMMFAGDTFLWRPYARYVENWEFPKYYPEEGRLVLIHEEVDEEVLSFGRCLRACELVGFDCEEQYLPHRVGRQFGMDQDIPESVPRLNYNLELAWSSYNKQLNGSEVYLPSRLHEGNVTLRYSQWWAPMLAHEDDPLTIVHNRRSLRIVEKLSYCGLPLVSSPEPCRESEIIDVGSLESGEEREMEISAPCKSIVSLGILNLAPKSEPLSVMSPLNEAEDTKTCEHVAPEVNDDNMYKCNMLTDDGSKQSEGSCSQVDSSNAVRHTLQGPRTEKLCSVVLDNDDRIVPFEALMNPTANSLDSASSVIGVLEATTVSETLYGSHEGNGKETRHYTSPACEHTIGLAVANANSPSCEGVPSENPLNVVDEAVQVSMMNLQLEPVLQTFGHDDEQAKATEDADANPVNKSFSDPLFISDDEDNNDYRCPLEARGIQLEGRITRLKSAISSLMAVRHESHQ